MEALKRSAVKKSLGFGAFVFCRGGYNDTQSIAARMYAGGAGISEDPATGSANGCLAGYLIEHDYFASNNIEISVGQGYEIDRPSTLYLRATRGDNNQYDINVGGRVGLVAKGELL
jgi:trans-2,3-dihydro-3-hydroxyanthranilate isomerase